MIFSVLFLLSCLTDLIVSAPTSVIDDLMKRPKLNGPQKSGKLSNDLIHQDLIIQNAIQLGDTEKLRLALSHKFSSHLLPEFIHIAAIQEQYLAVIELAAVSGDNIIALNEAFNIIATDNPMLISILMTRTNRIFTEAARKGNTEVLDVLLEHSTGNMQTLSKNLYGLHQIAKRSNQITIKTNILYHFISESENVPGGIFWKLMDELDTATGQSLLLDAINKQDLYVFEKILQLAIDIDYRKVINAAVRNPDLERFRIAIFLHLCTYGNIKDLDTFFKTPKSLDVTKLEDELLEQFTVVDPSIRSRSIDPSFLLILDGIHLAVDSNKYRAAKYLMSKIDVTAENNLLLNRAVYENNEYLVRNLLRNDKVVRTGVDRAIKLAESQDIASQDIYDMLHDRSFYANE